MRKTDISKYKDEAAPSILDLALSAAGGVFAFLGRIFFSVLLAMVVTGIVIGLSLLFYILGIANEPLNINLDTITLNQTSKIYVQNYETKEWEEDKQLYSTENRVWVSYQDIPKQMIDAQIAIEDKRFYEHDGIDMKRTAGAVFTLATGGREFGGSTITQQLLKNLTGKDEVTVQRKLTEIFGALELEKKYDKQEILEWYLNAVYFGEGCWGVGIAAQTYFGKEVKDLTLAESAAIVGITNMPTYYDPFYNEENNKQRQETILREMYEQGYIDYATWQDAVNAPLVFTRTPNQEYHQEIYSYYEEVVIRDVIRDLMEVKGITYDAAQKLLYNGGYQIYSCMDSRIQQIVDAQYSDPNQMPKGGPYDQQFQSAIVIMNPYDGRILALCGGVGEKNINFGLNRAVPVFSGGVDYGGATRSPGSSIKPLASYGPALNEGLITPDTLVNDANYIVLAGTNWYPHNDNYANYGVLSIYQALKWSLNTVAAQIVDKLPNGPQTSYDYLTQRLGFTSLVPDDASYAPMALGQLTNGVSVREMTQAYCTLVNDGTFTYSRTYSMVTDSNGNIVIDNVPRTIQAFDPNTAYCLTWMMKNAVQEGTGTEAQLSNMPVAGKTGTSGEYKDRWFAGATPYYVAVVWTGFDIPERIASNGNPAARVWRQIMSKVHSGLTWTDFTYPYLGPDTHVFIEAPTQGARSDQDLILDGITTDDFDGSYYWDNYYSGYDYSNDYGGNASVVVIG